MRCFLALLFFCLPVSAGAFEAVEGSFTHDGRTRTHYFHAPESAGPETPLVIALHGMGGNARNLRHGIGLTELLDEAGFAVVYPQGVRLPQGSRHWNAGFGLMEVDDIGYLTALAENLIESNGLSREKVMVFGISMGGYMAYHMACRSALPIGGIVVVAGSMHPEDRGSCGGGPRASLLHIHGRLDPLIPFEGGHHWTAPGRKTASVSDIVDNWAAALKAAPAQGVVENSRVMETRYLNRGAGKEVQLLVLPAFGHDWPSNKTAGYHAVEDVVAFLARQL